MSVTYKNNTAKTITKMESSLVKGLEAGARIMEVKMKERMSPGFGIQSGDWKASIQPEPAVRTVNGYESSVEDGMEYGAGVEFGQSNYGSFEPRLIFTEGGRNSMYDVQNEILKQLQK